MKLLGLGPTKATAPCLTGGAQHRPWPLSEGGPACTPPQHCPACRRLRVGVLHLGMPMGLWSAPGEGQRVGPGYLRTGSRVAHPVGPGGRLTPHAVVEVLGGGQAVTSERACAHKCLKAGGGGAGAASSASMWDGQRGWGGVGAPAGLCSPPAAWVLGGDAGSGSELPTWPTWPCLWPMRCWGPLGWRWPWGQGLASTRTGPAGSLWVPCSRWAPAPDRRPRGALRQDERRRAGRPGTRRRKPMARRRAGAPSGEPRTLPHCNRRGAGGARASRRGRLTPRSRGTGGSGNEERVKDSRGGPASSLADRHGREVAAGQPYLHFQSAVLTAAATLRRGRGGPRERNRRSRGGHGGPRPGGGAGPAARPPGRLWGRAARRCPTRRGHMCFLAARRC